MFASLSALRARFPSLPRSTGAWAALVAMVLLCAALNPSFRQPENLLNVASQVSYSGLIALGMTLVIAAGGIDLSVGALLAFSGVLAVMGMNAAAGADWPWAAQVALGVAIALGAGLGGGAMNGSLIAYCRQPPFIVTVGTLSIFQSLAKYLSNAATLTVKGGAFDEVIGDAMPLLALVGGVAVLSTVLHRTPFGLRVCAVGSNEQVARYAGIRTASVKFRTYLLTGFLSGASAVLYLGNLNSISSTAGTLYELDAIAAVIIGGTPMTGGKATVAGTLAGVLILGVINNILNMCDISNNLQGVIKGAVIIIAVLIQRKK